MGRFLRVFKKSGLEIFAMVCLFFAIGLRLFAEADPAPVPNEQWALELITWLFSITGASALAIAGGATQLLMRFFLTTWGDIAGKWKLVLVSFFSLVSLVIGGMATGLTFLEALMLGPVLAAFQVFFHQLMKQFSKDETPVVRVDTRV